MCEWEKLTLCRSDFVRRRITRESKYVIGLTVDCGEEGSCPRCGEWGLVLIHGAEETCTLCGLEVVTYGNTIRIRDHAAQTA